MEGTESPETQTAQCTQYDFRLRLLVLMKGREGRGSATLQRQAHEKKNWSPLRSLIELGFIVGYM